MLLSCLGASSSFEDQWTSLNGSAPLDLGQANGPQEPGRGYRPAHTDRHRLFLLLLLCFTGQLFDFVSEPV